MSDHTEDLAGIGHNQPPPADRLNPIDLRMSLSNDMAPLLARVKDLQAATARFQDKHTVKREQVVRGRTVITRLVEIANEDQQGKAGAFIGQMQAAAKVAKDEFTKAKRPYLDCGRVVDAFFNDIKAQLEAAMDVVRAPMNEYANRVEQERRAAAEKAAREAKQRADEIAASARRAEEKRRADEEAARIANLPPPAAPIDEPPPSIDDAIAAAQIAEKAEAVAAGRAADFSRTRGEFGTTSSLVTHVTVELIDLSLVPLEFMTFNESAARKAAIAGRTEIPGVRIVRTKNIRVT